MSDSKPYRLTSGYDQQGIELDYRDIIRIQAQLTPEQFSDVSLNGNPSTKQFIVSAPGLASPLTTKGDIWTYSTTNARLGVGADTKVLVADSTQATGLNWASNVAGVPLTTKGDLLTDSGSALVRVGVGSRDQVGMIADADNTNGVRWSDKFWVPQKFRRYAYTQSQDGVNTLVHTGWSSSATLNGQSTSADSDGMYVGFTTATTLNSLAGFESSLAAGGSLTRADYLPSFSLVIKTGPLSTDIQNVRLWFALNNFLGGTIHLSDTPNDYILGWRFSTSASDVNWQCITFNNTAHTISNSNVAVASNTQYKLSVVMTSSSNANFYINDNLVATSTTNLPAAGNALGLSVTGTNLSAGTAREFKFEQMKCSMD